MKAYTSLWDFFMKITLLNKENIDSSNVIQILAHPSIVNEYAVQTTDFAVLTGASLNSDLSDTKQYANLIWTKSPCKRNIEYDYGMIEYKVVMDISNRNKAMWPNSREACILPIINLEEAQKERDYKIIGEISDKRAKKVQLVQVGSYPQTLADKKTSVKLTLALKKNQLIKTDKSYTINTLEMFYYTQDIRTQCLTPIQEYEFEGEKYVQVVATLSQNDDKTKNKIQLKDSEYTIKNKKPYWVKVEPLTWLVDEKNGILISQKAILSGIRFDNNNEYNGDFSQTEMNAFCSKYLSKEIHNREDICVENFKSFVMAQLKNKISSMQRLEYFKKLLSLAKYYVGKSITNQELKNNEDQIIKYTKQHIQTMTKQSDETPNSMLRVFCNKNSKPDKQENKSIGLIDCLKNTFQRN